MQYDTSLTAARIGKGKAVHHYYPGATRTSCAAGGMGDAPATIIDEAITCKTCLKSLARDVEYYHGVALAEEAARTSARQAYADVQDAKRVAAEVATAKPVHVYSKFTGALYVVEGFDGGRVWLRSLTGGKAVTESQHALSAYYQGCCAHEDAQGDCEHPDCLPTPFRVGDRVRSRFTSTIGHVFRADGSRINALTEYGNQEMEGHVAHFKSAPLQVVLRAGDLVTRRSTGRPGRVEFVGGTWANRIVHVESFGRQDVGQASDYEPRYQARPTVTGRWGVVTTSEVPEGALKWVLDDSRNALRYGTFHEADAQALAMFRRP
jgi:hypothetical protein